MARSAAKTTGKTKRTTTRKSKTVDESKIVEGIYASCSDFADVDTALHRAIQALKPAVPFDAVTVYRPERESGELTVITDFNHRVGMLDFLSIGSGLGLTGWSASSAQPVLIADRSRITDDAPEIVDASFISFPLCLEDRLIAVFNFGADAARTFTKTHVSMLQKLSGPLAFAVENILLNHDLVILRQYRDHMKRDMERGRDSVSIAQSLNTIIDLATETNHVVNEALSIIVGNIQCVMMEGGVTNQKGTARLRRVEEAALNINECNRKLLRIAAMVEKAAKTSEAG